MLLSFANNFQRADCVPFISVIEGSASVWQLSSQMSPPTSLMYNKQRRTVSMWLADVRLHIRCLLCVALRSYTECCAIQWALVLKRDLLGVISLKTVARYEFSVWGFEKKQKKHHSCLQVMPNDKHWAFTVSFFDHRLSWWTGIMWFECWGLSLNWDVTYYIYWRQ